MEAVTYSAPSVVDLLDDKTREKVFAGEFDSSIVNYVHPKDSIGAGGLAPYERHIGSTYYIGSRFKYENMDNEGRPIRRLIESISGDNYHSMDHYQFDKYGNISNGILYNVLAGVEISRSPRNLGADVGIIKVTPVHLKEVADSFDKVTKSILREQPHVKGKIQSKLVHGEERPETKQVGYVTMNELVKMASWLNEESSAFTHFLRNAASEYERADKLT